MVSRLSPRSETVYDLERRQEGLIKSITLTEKKLINLTVKKAQAESDKIELMRDHATYEASACTSLGLNSTYTDLLAMVKVARR